MNRWHLNLDCTASCALDAEICTLRQILLKAREKPGHAPVVKLLLCDKGTPNKYLLKIFLSIKNIFSGNNSSTGLMTQNAYIH